MKKIFLTVMAAAGMLAATAQIKEGMITYSVEVQGVPPEQAAMMKGMELSIYFKDKKSRAEFVTAFMSSTTVSDENGSTTLMDGMGNKSYVKMNKADMEKEGKKNPDPKITYVDEKKTIAGYECKKAIIESKDEKGQANKATVWYSEKIPFNGNGGRMTGQFKGLKGAPLEFESQQGPMKMKMTATKVTTESVPDSKFVVNTDGYTEMKMDDLKKMRGGQ